MQDVLIWVGGAYAVWCTVYIARKLWLTFSGRMTMKNWNDTTPP